MESLEKETQEEMVQVQEARWGERCENIDATVNGVRGQVIHNKEKIEEPQQRELLNIREELEMIRYRPVHVSGIQNLNNREGISFKQYKKNPMEFLERVEENIARNRENRWTSIWSMLEDTSKISMTTGGRQPGMIFEIIQNLKHSLRQC